VSLAALLVAVASSATIIHGSSLAAATTGDPGLEQQSASAGQLVVSFLYMPPTEVEPTYHTAMWLEDKAGKLVKTLFVSNELSANEYKKGEACPDWVRQANWEKAEKSLVDAVSGPTPNVGSGAMSFDLGALGVPPATYIFNFQVHIENKYNVRFRGPVTVGPARQDVTIETLYSEGKPPDDIVRDVVVQYVPPKAQ
jgi:hypothetical protein